MQLSPLLTTLFTKKKNNNNRVKNHSEATIQVSMGLRFQTVVDEARSALKTGVFKYDAGVLWWGGGGVGCY